MRAELGGGADSFMTFVPHGGGISVDGGTGADSLDAYAGTTPASVTYAADLIGGEGADALAGDGGADTLDGGAGNDTLRGHGGPDELVGGSESDALTGDTGQDTLRGGEGADDLAGGAEGDDLDGEGGNDELAGDAGDDELAGGTGNDRFEEGAGRDDIAGGAGVDHVTYQLESYDTTAITLDDAANDGDAGEQNNVRSDVEDVTTANGGSTTSVTGSAVRNVLTALADRNTVSGGAGNDLIVTTCYPNCIDGGDVVDGGPGADEITGGPGPDEIYADNCSSYTCSEPDVIDVVDGERDDVYCGGGGDVVRADPVAQLLLCAHVTIDGDTTKPPPPTITTTTTTAAQQSTPQTSAAAPKRCRVPKLRKLTLAKAKQRLKAAGCRVGKVRKPRGAAARRLVVRKQSRRAGSTVPRATKVNLTLARRARA